jgi:hypothetical protein
MFGGIGIPELIVLLVIGIILLPGIFFLLTLQKCLQRCSPQSRTMAPGLLWLMLIPLFNVVWQFIIVLRVASSLGNEFRLRNVSKESEPGQSIGLAVCILNLCGIIPVIGAFAAIAAFVCWIIYWVKIANYSSELVFPATAVMT